MSSPQARHFVTISGSSRVESIHTTLLKYAETLLAEAGASTERLNVHEMAHYNSDHDTPENAWAVALRSTVSASDGLLIATPTYNYSVPSSVKAFIDWMSRPFGNSATAGRRLALITAAPGPQGGQPGAEYLTRIGTFFKAEIVQPATLVPNAMASVDPKTGAISEDVRAQIQATVAALMAPVITIAAEPGRYVLKVDGVTAAFAEFRQINPDGIVEMPHTVTDPAYRGQGLARRVVTAALDQFLAEGRTVVPSCPYVAEVIAGDAKYSPLLKN